MIKIELGLILDYIFELNTDIAFNNKAHFNSY